jgi:hypothetical protein
MAKKKVKPESQKDKLGQVSPALINEELGIIRFVEKETRDEKVKAFEKVKTEQVFDTQMDIWSVQTDKNKYWVITNPPALYSHALFANLDYTITFHVGLTYRVASNERADLAEKEQDQLAMPWRLWEQAVAAFTRAETAEEFRVIGVLCRSCLLAFVKVIIRDELVPLGQERPKLDDFFHWSELIANSIAHGSSPEALRAYLITISKAAWKLVNWLMLEANATRLDGNMAIEATEYVLMAFGAALQAEDAGDG